jgi:hypothetical protein
MQTAEATAERLAARHAAQQQETHALWAMTAEQRRTAMHHGELTQRQLLQWASRRPKEVPLINGEFAFIAALTPEVADHADPERERQAPARSPIARRRSRTAEHDGRRGPRGARPVRTQGSPPPRSRTTRKRTQVKSSKGHGRPHEAGRVSPPEVAADRTRQDR